MNKTAIGIIAALAVAAVLSVAGLSLASAQSEYSSTPSGTAQDVRQARDALATAVQLHDLAGVRKAADQLVPALAAVHTELDRGALRPETANYLSTAERQNAELRAQLTVPAPRGGILDSVTGLVNSLLDTVKGLLNGLLGGGGSSSTTTTTSTSSAG
ncbi:hypothetical protein GCM10010174_13180 [Kutzneria viridogrisea]|uniref:Uncharacterized protein n=1 Tax=Kutzneria viridogrisea TaxID=47990 RepID=A0ABR6BHG5_9PSEU|nr:hypothetical protein [Kutzneria viridogrisea]